MKHWSIYTLVLFCLFACKEEAQKVESSSEIIEESIHYPNSKPGTRWWWFATEIKKEDVKHQLDWFKKNNFGAVEIAWVYPLHRYERMYRRMYNRYYPTDTTAQKWLSKEWIEAVSYTKRYADSIGIACDFTLGSGWPVATSNLDPKYRAQIYGVPEFNQTLTFAWSWPDTLNVINHLDEKAFQVFADPIAKALEEPLKGSRSALFTDSWEIKLNGTNKIWTQGFEGRFLERFGYDIIPYMEDSLDLFPDVRYDYMLLLDEYVTNGFYKPYVQKCKDLGTKSRVQCLASPTDVMTTYSLVDIPETEAMLNNPNYSRIVSSAAALSKKPLVSSETFTCMYGFPHTYQREEQTADLKMVADALFAQGVNHHFYHGSPYNPVGSDTIEFFATTYFGPGGNLEPELPAFNQYIEKVSGILQKGKTYADVAVYIPYEDRVMQGALPKEKQRKWVWGEYELRYEYTPDELKGHHPIWVNRHFLTNSIVESNQLVIGEMSFSCLYVDVQYMDVRALKRIAELAKQGVRVVLKRDPIQPGKNKSEEYQNLIQELKNLSNVQRDFSPEISKAPLISGDSIPDYWCRVDEEKNHYIFLAQRLTDHLEYPVYSGQSFVDESYTREFSFQVNGHQLTKELEFKPYQSLLVKINADGQFELLDIEFVPKDPEIKERKQQKMYF